MAFPTPPPIDIPRWAYVGGVYTEPPSSVRETGFTAVPGQNYAEPPPYQWINWLQYSDGEWIYYIAASALPYLQQGNFDSGINLFNNFPAKFYNAANNKYVSLKSSPTQSVASVDLILPSTLPTSPAPMVCDSSGNLNFVNIYSSSVSGITNGSSLNPGQVGEYYVQNAFYGGTAYNTDTVLYSQTFSPGVWCFTYSGYTSIGQPSTSFSDFNVFNIWINTTSIPPVPSYNGYNYLSSSGLTQALNLVLPDYYINSSVSFDIFLGCKCRSNISTGGNVWYSFRARRIA